jgi:hypothetical protein
MNRVFGREIQVVTYTFFEKFFLLILESCKHNLLKIYD